MQKNHWRNSAPIQPTDNAFMENDKNLLQSLPPPYTKINQNRCVYGCMLSCVQLFATARTVADRLICPWYFPGKNTGVGCHFLFQGIFLTQGLKPSPLFLLHWQANSLPLSHLGSPEWITDLNVIAKTLQYLEDSFLSSITYFLKVLTIK